MHLEANLALLRPFQVIPNMTFSISEPHFVLQISQPPIIAQKWFCIQNLHMDISFQQKKAVCKSVPWFLKYEAKRKVIIFFGTPCMFLPIIVIKLDSN